jgi:hypothetical protein
MPQIFHPSTNTFSKASIFSAIFILGGLAWALAQFFRSAYITNVNVAIVQPVQFSHEHHVAGLGIDCRYCHTSVGSSAFADVPPTHTCMTCHSQIWVDSPELAPVRESFRTGLPIQWNRVNDLPDFVYFDHSIHVNRGVACEICHGEVGRMPLTWKAETLYMEWCLECHRHPEEYVRPQEAVYDTDWNPPAGQIATGRQLVDQYGIASPLELDDCTICHR